MAPRLVLIVLCWLLPGCATTDRVMSEEQPPAAVAASRVGWDDFNADWLAAAIFAETNRVRLAHDLRPLRSHRNLAGAAELQAITNALLGAPSHHNPLAGRANVQDRVIAQGIRPWAAWENVAVTLVRQRTSGGAARIVVGQDGSRNRRDDLTGDELRWPIYGELASRIVQQWMDSPPHRANLLRPEATRLACGTALSRIPWGREVVYSIQVFISKTPL